MAGRAGGGARHFHLAGRVILRRPVAAGRKARGRGLGTTAAQRGGGCGGRAAHGGAARVRARGAGSGGGAAHHQAAGGRPSGWAPRSEVACCTGSEDGGNHLQGGAQLRPHAAAAAGHPLERGTRDARAGPRGGGRRLRPLTPALCHLCALPSRWHRHHAAARQPRL